MSPGNYFGLGKMHGSYVGKASVVHVVLYVY